MKEFDFLPEFRLSVKIIVQLPYGYLWYFQDHIIAANEGNAVALAAGYHLATGKIPVVYAEFW